MCYNCVTEHTDLLCQSPGSNPDEKFCFLLSNLNTEECLEDLKECLEDIRRSETLSGHNKLSIIPLPRKRVSETTT